MLCPVSSRRTLINLTKVVSFTVWGDSPIYTVGAVKNADLVAKHYPEFEAWFSLGKSVPEDIIAELEARPNTKVIRKDGPEDQTATMWRFQYGPEDGVELLMPRDTDSRIELREVAAVREWLETDYELHVMRDHPWHNVPMLAGMFGARGNALHRLSKWSKIYPARDYYQTDQVFLSEYIYTIFRLEVLAHDEYFHFEDEIPNNRRPFPTARIDGQFCCQGYDENDNLRFPTHQYGRMEME
jgi:protein O-GlcNAc transferase